MANDKTPSNPPESERIADVKAKKLTVRQQIARLNKGREFLARHQAAEEAAANRAQERAAIKAAKLAVIHEPTRFKGNVRKALKFAFMPELNRSFQGFGLGLALLVQVFAQVLITVGLLPEDHIAQTLNGARSKGVFQLLEEARLNLLPKRLIWEGFKAGGTSGIRVLAMRQYIIFASLIGVLVTGGLAISAMLARTIFGSAHAFAQGTGGTGMTLGSFSATSDLASNFLDAAFGGTNSVISSGLGTMFAIYSNAMLIFAGIIVLWIIISAVAETARTGIPFGKQFNHVWAPIRLIVALGLLIPLGSGLNSGQYLVISLARWGSTQATTLWSAFADNMMISTATNAAGGTSTSVNGALNALPLSLSSTRSVADQAFDMMLCQEMQNAYYTKFSSVIPNASNMMVSHSSPIFSQTPAGLSTVTTAGAVAQKTPATSIYTISFGRTKDDSGNQIVDANNNPTTDGSCGNLSLQIPTSSPVGQVQAADITKSQILTGQSTDLANLVSTNSIGYQLAHQIAQDAINYVTGPGTTGPAYDWNSWGASTKQNIATKYQAYVAAYTSARTQSVAQELTNYGTNLTNNLSGGSCGAGSIGCNLQSDTKTYGWASAPMWLNAISDQNGKVMATLDSSTPAVNASASGPSATGDGQLMDAWNAATEVEANATSNIGVGITPTTKQTAELMQNALRQLTQPSANPLGDLPAYGREFMATGVRLITPPNVATCLNDPSQLGCEWVLNDAIAQETKIEAGGGHGMVTLAKLQALKNNPNETSDYRNDVFQDAHGTLLPSGTKLDLITKLVQIGGNDSFRPYMGPIGLVLISFGFTLGYVLALIPFTRFMLGILNWMMQIFETLLAVPLLSLSLLKTDGEGFATQQFQAGMVMILGLILRPGLMIFGLVCSLLVFNGIYQIVAVTFLPTVLNLSGYNGDPDDSVISAAGYIIFYGTFAYTLANSAFKMIDLLPNYVMGWLGQRGESRTDDASMVQQQAAGYMQTLAYSMRTGGMRPNMADVLHNPNASNYERSRVGLGNAQPGQDASGRFTWINPSSGMGNNGNVGGGNPGQTTPSPQAPTTPPASTPNAGNVGGGAQK